MEKRTGPGWVRHARGEKKFVTQFFLASLKERVLTSFYLRENRKKIPVLKGNVAIFPIHKIGSETEKSLKKFS